MRLEDRGGERTGVGLSRSKETEGDRGPQGMRSKVGKQRRKKGKTSASASYQKHLLFPRKGNTASPKTNYSGRGGKVRHTIRREK